MTDANFTSENAGLRALLLIAASAAVVVLLHWPTFHTIASMWSLMPYRHGYLMFPVAAYFLWQERDEIGAQPVGASWVGCLLLLALTALWIVARATAVQAVQQLAVILMIPAVVLAAFGASVFRAAAFPLLLMVAAVPAGETLLPGLMTLTGDIAEPLLHAFKVPLFREGNLFVVPSGSFEVAAICAGLNYLLAGVVTAVVFARQSFVGWRGRLTYIAVAAAAFILANGIRVFLVIFLHNASGGRIFAQDHVWFGMIIFGLVLVMLFVLGTRFADRFVGTPTSEVQQPVARVGLSSLVAAGVATVIVAAGPLVAAKAETDVEVPSQWPALPVLEGCNGPGEWNAGWGPFMVGSEFERAASYDCGGVDVNLFVAVYANQRRGKEIVSSENELVPEHLAARGTRAGGSFMDAVDGPVATAEVSIGGGASELVWLWYSVGEASTSSDVGVKALEGLNVLRLRRAPSALYIVAVRGTARPIGDLRAVAARVAPTLWDSSRHGRSGYASP